jgi:hypothetical protein
MERKEIVLTVAEDGFLIAPDLIDFLLKLPDPILTVRAMTAELQAIGMEPFVLNANDLKFWRTELAKKRMVEG